MPARRSRNEELAEAEAIERLRGRGQEDIVIR